MITAVRVESLKLRTVRLGYGLLAIPAGLTIVFSILEASRAGTRSGGVAPLNTASGLDSVITGGVWFLIFAAVLGVTVSSGEFRHQTATATYLATPRRGRVLAAKALAAALGGAAFGVAGYLIALGIGLGFVAAKGYPVPIGDATLARYGAGHVLAAALLAAAGAGIGALVRSQLAGVIGVFVWTIIVESVLGGLFTSARPYLPYTAATALAGAPLGGGAFGPAHGASGAAGPLPFAAAAALLAALAAALCAAAARTTVRRDVA
jgi:ABC-2 type transport system permease protein